MGCKVKKAKDGAHLALQLFWNRIRSWETTRLEDTPENREFLQAKAVIISREMRKGTFDYVAHFPSGNRAHLFGAAPRIRAADLNTVRKYFAEWIKRRVHQVRPQQVRCDKSYFTRHILPAVINGQEFGDFYLASLTVHHLQQLQEFFKSERIDGQPYKAASVNKFIRALRAMLKDARRTGAMAINIFDRDLFSPLPETDSQSEIDPYLPEERERIFNGFLQHRRHYHAFVFHQFWTGCRPSEACALRRRDCDLNYGWERIDKSRVSGSQDGTKTGPSNRQIKLHDNLVPVLQEHARFILDPDAYLFTTTEGAPIDESNFYKREWLPMLRKLKIRPRPFYNTRHSYASFMISIGSPMGFISAQTGDKEATLRKHYAKYIEELDPNRKWVEDQIRKSEKSARKSEKSPSRNASTKPAKMKNPLVSQGVKSGAGEEGRTPDLMLGKHTL